MTKKQAIEIIKNEYDCVNTREEASNYVMRCERTWIDRVCEDIREALNQEPCENAISRQAVLDLAKKGVLISNDNYKSVCKAINELPSVNPQPICEEREKGECPYYAG